MKHMTVEEIEGMLELPEGSPEHRMASAVKEVYEWLVVVTFCPHCHGSGWPPGEECEECGEFPHDRDEVCTQCKDGSYWDTWQDALWDLGKEPT